MRKFIITGLFVLFAGPALALSDAPYLPASAPDAIDLLAPPPAADSALQKRDLAVLLDIQKTRTEEQIKGAMGGDLNSFAGALGPKFKAENLPITNAFVAKVIREAGAQVDRVKDCWQRSRPFVDHKEITPPGNQADGFKTKPGATVVNTAPHGPGSPCKPAETPAYSYSYPSGAANAGMTSALLLAAMVPEKRAEIFARGWQMGENRLILGVHYPSDVEAGKLLATATAGLMMANPAFKTDLATARAELRTALGLPLK